MSFTFQNEYKYIYKSDFNPNITILSKLYVPFLMKESFCLYVYMCEELRNFNTTKFFKNKIDEILKFLNMSNDDFERAKNNLEAFGLLKTYLSEDNKVYFELFEPLKFSEFIQNPSYKNNLEKRIGNDALNKLCSQYSDITIPENLKDITINEETFFEENNFDKISDFNFDKLFESLAKTTRFHIEMNDDVKKEIDFYFKEYKLSYSEIEKCIYSSVIKVKNQYTININLIQKELDSLVSRNANDLREIVKINHNKKMFIEKFSISDLNIIFKNYKNFVSEQFLTALTYEQPTENDMNIINLLRKRYALPDCFINIMIDFSIRKTHGELNEKYLSKMAKSFKLENIESLDEAYDFLLNWDNKKKRTETANKKEVLVKKDLKLDGYNNLPNENDNFNEHSLKENFDGGKYEELVEFDF